MIIGNRAIGAKAPTYFIADIGSNHDGSLERAVKLIHLAAQAGADAVKFQHFRAEHLVSDEGFKALGDKLGHQAKWKESVFDTYKRYEVPWEWTPVLADECFKTNVHFLSTPYDLEAVDHLDPFVPAFKIGSGDIDYFELLEKVAFKNKPIILGTGASSRKDLERAFHSLSPQPRLSSVSEIALLQCNTNYTGDVSSFQHVNLRVIQTLQEDWEVDAYGLSDHTPGHVAVLGAVALGARIIEKHFTDDNALEGPDHPFALDPQAWRSMVSDVRLLEAALGDGVKRVEANEEQTRIIQRRGTWGGKRLRPAHG